MDVGEKILLEIRRQRRDQTEVAKTAGVARETLTKIIRGQVTPREDTVGLIANALEVDVKALLSEPEGEMGRAVGTAVPAGFGVNPGLNDNLKILREA